MDSPSYRDESNYSKYVLFLFIALLSPLPGAMINEIRAI